MWSHERVSLRPLAKLLVCEQGENKYFAEKLWRETVDRRRVGGRGGTGTKANASWAVVSQSSGPAVADIASVLGSFCL